MSAEIVIEGAGLVTAVGLSAATSCAAMRAKLTNPSETRFLDSQGDRIIAHQVELEEPWRGIRKLARMAAMAAEEALATVPAARWCDVPVLLCVAEKSRPGRLAGLDADLLSLIEAELGVVFPASSAIVAYGRIGVAIALERARHGIGDSSSGPVLIVAVDSYLHWPTLRSFERQGRLLTDRNSDGFIPGEAAGALLVVPTDRSTGGLVCRGIGFGREEAFIDSGRPLRADGLTHTLRAALDQAGIALHEMDYRIADVSGEQYYFREAALAVARTMREVKDEFDIWHPAECAGETGAASGVLMIALAEAAAREGYARGPNILLHWANDAGERAAIALQQRTPA